VLAAGAPISVRDFEADFPDCVLVVYRYLVPSEAFPAGFDALIAIPRGAIDRAIANGKKPPFWKHGEVIVVRPESEQRGVRPCGAVSRIA
jgi:hypothetical protein